MPALISLASLQRLSLTAVHHASVCHPTAVNNSACCKCSSRNRQFNSCLHSLVITSCAQVLALLGEHLRSSPHSLGDARKESAEELADRHGRVLSAACAMISELVTIATASAPATVGLSPSSAAVTTTAALPSVADASAVPGAAAERKTGSIEENRDAAFASVASGDGAAGTLEQESSRSPDQEILNCIEGMVCTAEFFKSVLGSKSAAVRRAGYELVATLSDKAPQLLQVRRSTSLLTVSLAVSQLWRSEPCSLLFMHSFNHHRVSGAQRELMSDFNVLCLQRCTAAAAPFVLGAFSDKVASNHAALWACVLLYVRAVPSCWRHVNMQKVVEVAPDCSREVFRIHGSRAQCAEFPVQQNLEYCVV